MFRAPSAQNGLCKRAGLGADDDAFERPPENDDGRLSG